MATHFSILAWKIPWAEESCRLQSPWGCKESDITEHAGYMPRSGIAGSYVDHLLLMVLIIWFGSLVICINNMVCLSCYLFLFAPFVLSSFSSFSTIFQIYCPFFILFSLLDYSYNFLFCSFCGFKVYSVYTYYSIPSSNIILLHGQYKNVPHLHFPPPDLCTIVIHFNSTCVVNLITHCYYFCFNFYLCFKDSKSKKIKF